MLMVDRRQVLTADPRDAVLSLKQISLDFPAGTTPAPLAQHYWRPLMGIDKRVLIAIGLCIVIWIIFLLSSNLQKSKNFRKFLFTVSWMGAILLQMQEKNISRDFK